MTFRDPWLVREVNNVIASEIGDPSRTPSNLSVLSPEERASYVESIRQALYDDPSLNAFCEAQRKRVYFSWQAEARSLQSFVRFLDTKEQKVAPRFLGDATLTHEEVAKRTPVMRKILSSLQQAARRAPTAARAEAAAQGAIQKQARVSLADLQQQESAFDAVGYARSIGKRIRAYRNAVAENTPASVTKARHLWTELFASLSGWLIQHGSDAIKKLAAAPRSGDENLLAFLTEGYVQAASGNIVVSGEWAQRRTVLYEWNPLWVAPPAAAARWLYDAGNESLSVERLLSFYSIEAHENILAAVLGGDGGEAAWCLRGPTLSDLVPADGFLLSGNLVAHRNSLQTHLTDYTTAHMAAMANVQALVEASAPDAEVVAAQAALDPWFQTKTEAADRQIAALVAATQNIGAGWGDIAGALTPRDPWLPLDVLSAFVSGHCQFPWADWNPLFTHPASNMGGAYPGKPTMLVGASEGAKKPWFFPTEGLDTTVQGAPDAFLAWSPTQGEEDEDDEDAEVEEDDEGSGDEGGGGGGEAEEEAKEAEIVPLNPDLFPLGAYDPSQLTVKEGDPPGDLRSPVLRYQATAASGYNRWKYLRNGAAWARLDGLGKISGFTPWRLEVVKLTDETGGPSGIYAYRTWDWYDHVLRTGEGYEDIDRLYRLPYEDRERFKETFIAHNGTTRDGANPAIRLIRGALPEGGAVRVPRVIPGDLFRRDGATRPSVVRSGRRPRGSTGPDLRPVGGPTKDNIGCLTAFPPNGRRIVTGVSPVAWCFLAYLNADHTLLPSGLDTLASDRKTIFRAFTGRSGSRDAIVRKLYSLPWGEADGYVSMKEVAADETGRVAAEADGYVGSVDPGLIPQASRAKTELLGKEYTFTLGLVGRMCASAPRGEDDTDEAQTRLWPLEQTYAVPEPSATLLTRGGEWEEAARRARIETIEAVIGGTFRRWMDAPSRKGFQDAALKNYNAIWAGYLDPAQGAKRKYSSVAQYGTEALSTQIVRWNRAPDADQLFDFQSDAVLRLHDRRGGLLAFDVGVGKCARFRSLVLTSTGLGPIGGLFPKDARTLGIGEDETFPAPPGLQVSSLTPKGIVWQPVEALYRQRLPDDEATFTVRLRKRGADEEHTGAHPYLALRDGRPVWTPLRNLLQGDRIAVPAYLPEPEAPSTIAPDLAVLLTWQLTDGAEAVGNTARIWQKEPAVLTRLQAIFGRLFPGEKAEIEVPIDGHTPYLYLSSAKYREAAEAIGYPWGTPSADRKFPSCFLGLAREPLRRVLRAFFDAEGDVQARGTIELSSASKGLLVELRYLLLRFGIHGRLSSKEVEIDRGPTTYWRLVLTGEDAAIFAVEIGSDKDDKAVRLEVLVGLDRNPNIDGVPVYDVLAALADAGVPLRRVLGGQPNPIPQIVSHERAAAVEAALLDFLDPEWVLTERRRVEAVGPPGNLRRIQSLDRILSASETIRTVLADLGARLALDVRWDEVEAVEPGEVGGCVYDLQVGTGDPFRANYVGGEGAVLLHNTHTALGAIGWAKQQGLIRRPVILVPNSLRIKWWKDCRALYPDWSIAVLGTSLRFPRTLDDLNVAQRRGYDTLLGMAVKGYVAAGYEPEDAGQLAATAVLRLTIEGGKPTTFIPADVMAALDVPTRAAFLGMSYSAAPVSWCADGPGEAAQKLRAFRDGYLDVLIASDTNFKSIAVEPGAVAAHVRQSSALRADLFLDAYPPTQRGRGGGLFDARAGAQLRAYIRHALSYLNAPAKNQEQISWMIDLWSWCRRLPGDEEPYTASVEACVSNLMAEYAGLHFARYWEPEATRFFKENYLLPRSRFSAEAKAALLTLLWNPDGGAYSIALVGADEAITIPIEESTQAKMLAAGAPLPTGDAPAFDEAVELTYAVALVRAGADFYPDGARIPGSTDHYVQPDYSSGLVVLRRINEEITGFAGLRAVLGAKAAAEAVAAFINANPAEFPRLGGKKVQVVPARTPIARLGLPASIAARIAEIEGGPTMVIRPPDLADDDYAPIISAEQASKAAGYLSKVPEPYYTQPDVRTEPELYWDHPDPRRSLGVDCLIVDEAHRYKGMIDPRMRGGEEVAFLGGGSSATRAWLLEYMTSTVRARGGRVILLTATPAKQSPLDYFNILQFLGMPYGGDRRGLAYTSLFQTDTAEQFISRFVKIVDKTIVTPEGTVKNGLTAECFDQGTIREFRDLMRRNMEQKAVVDLKKLRGTTAAEGGPFLPGGRDSSSAPWYAGAVFNAQTNEVRIAGFDPTKALPAVIGEGTAFRVHTGDAAANYELRSASFDAETATGVLVVEPAFNQDSTRTAVRKGDDWAIYLGAKVPIAPWPAKPLVDMDPEQRKTYEAYQRAFARMHLDDVAQMTVRILGVPTQLERATMFNRMARLAMHPDLESVDTGRGVVKQGVEETEAEAEAVGGAGTAALGGLRMVQTKQEPYTYAFAVALDPVFDAVMGLVEALKEKRTRAAVAAYQPLVGVMSDDRKATRVGLNGKVTVPSPEFQLLNDLYARVRQNRTEWINQGGEGAAWAEAPSSLGPRPLPTKATKGKRGKKKVIEAEVEADLVTPTNGEDLARILAALDPKKNAKVRGAAARLVWHDEAPIFDAELQDTVGWGRYLTEEAGKPTVSLSVADIVEGVGRTGTRPVPTIEPMSSRVLGIADRIVAGQIEDRRLALGEPTCGNLVFSNSLAFQSWLVIGLCRFTATTDAALVELERYFTTASVLDYAVLDGILMDYFGAWAPYWTVRALLYHLSPTLRADNDGARDLAAVPAAPRPAEETADPNVAVLRSVLTRWHAAFLKTRYSTAKEQPPFWASLSGKPETPSPRPSFNWDTGFQAYTRGWLRAAARTCTMNATTAKADDRAELAERFNGSFIDIERPDPRNPGKFVEAYVATRAPIYDVVIANSVAYEGIDLQVRTCRIIHADLPWTPSDFIQRNGRAVRQGNVFKRVQILVFVTEDTVDWYKVQSLERKRGWLESALMAEGDAYELSTDEDELMALVVRSVHPDDREAVADLMGRRRAAIMAKNRTRGYTHVRGRIEAAVNPRRKLDYLVPADPVGYKGDIEKHTKSVRSVLASGESGGGTAGRGGADIYGWQYQPSYYEVCQQTILAGRIALPNPIPRPGEPAKASPLPPLVEGALYGGFFPEAPGSTYERRFGRLVFGENDAARNLRVWNGRQYVKCRFVPTLWSGRVGRVDPAANEARTAGLHIGLLPILGRDRYAELTPIESSWEYGSAKGWMVPSAGSEAFLARFGDRALTSGLAPFTYSGGTTFNNAVVIPASLEEVQTYLARFSESLVARGRVQRILPWTIQGGQFGGSDTRLNRIGFANAEWLQAAAPFVEERTREWLSDIDPSDDEDNRKKYGFTYIPFVERGELRITNTRAFLDARSRAEGGLWDRLVAYPKLVRERIERGEDVPTPEVADAQVKAAVADLEAARERRTEAGKATTIARNAAEAAEKARKNAAEKVSKARDGVKAAQDALDGVEAAIASMTANEVEVPAKMTERLTTLKGARDEAAAAVTATQAIYTAATEAVDAANTAEGDAVRAEVAARGAVDDFVEQKEEAERTAKIAGARDTRIIVPSVEGYAEFIRLARACRAVGSATWTPGEVTPNELLSCFYSWFSGSSQPEEPSAWYGTQGAPTVLRATMLDLISETRTGQIGIRFGRTDVLTRIASGSGTGVRKRAPAVVAVKGADGKSYTLPVNLAAAVRPGMKIVDPNQPIPTIDRILTSSVVAGAMSRAMVKGTLETMSVLGGGPIPPELVGVRDYTFVGDMLIGVVA